MTDKADREVRKVLRRHGFKLWDDDCPFLFEGEADEGKPVIAIVHKGEAFFYYQNEEMDRSDLMDPVMSDLEEML